MNPKEILVYHYSKKNSNWYDATDNVVWYKQDEKAWKVKYNNSEKEFFVSFRNMHVYTNPKVVEFEEVYYNKLPCYNVTQLLSFDGKIYKIFFKAGYTCIALPNEIRIVTNVLKSDKKALGVLSYYKKVLAETCKSEEDSFLVSQFEDISCVDQDSVLALFLKGETGQANNSLKKAWICPFGLNLSQSAALKMAFKNRISIIEGPPGTGKTQTILNIISNAVINGMSVAVVSNNNSATTNVFEKLEKYGYSFIAAPLGNADNIDHFFEEYNSKIPEFEKTEVDESILNTYFTNLGYYFEIDNKQKKTIEKKDALDLEYSHFLANANSNYLAQFKCKKKASSKDVLAVYVTLKEKKRMSFFDKVHTVLKTGIKTKFFKLEGDEQLVILVNLFYLCKLREIDNEIKKCDEILGQESFLQKIESFTELSKKYFENSIKEIYKNSKRNVYQKDNYKRLFEDFVKEYPVILSSTYSLAKCSKKGFLFDYLIVDESSQVNMASALLSMRVAKNIVIVGDIKQLPQIDIADFKERNEQLLKEFNVARAYSYYGNSIMSSLIALYGNKIPRQMLKEHYRCDPNIIGFCNEEFYDGRLVVYKEKNQSAKTMRVIKTVAGNFARKNPNGGGLYNQREIDEIKRVLDEESLEDVGIITPYNYQASLIQEQLGDRVESSTVHKFQGREKKTIIFSSVVNDVNDFVDNDNLINVAVSRAIEKFILVASDKVTRSNKGVLSDLVNYISYHGDFGQVDEGTVKSIYDLLYEEYSESLELFRKKYPSNDYDSENITRKLLDQLLSTEAFKSLKYAMHVPLNSFINEKKMSFSKEEYRFYKNPNSHADFLIYNKMSKKPLAVIEVDGVRFHEQKIEQVVRDKKKNSILEKAMIPLLRLKTNESKEENRITELFKQILN